MNKLKPLDIIALILVIIGGLNWGLVAAANFDLVAAILGDMTILARIVYGLVALAAIYVAIIMAKLSRKPKLPL